jgi:predicted flap endonuclease-1-like 5' DNA nuclease
MRDDEYDTTIGTGGWILLGLAGLVTFGILWGLLHYHLFPSVVFALAVALIVLLVLYRLAGAVNRYDDQEESQRVRRIVPASAEAGMRMGGAEGASGAVAVPVRAAPVMPQRPSSVVTPLAKVDPAPVHAPPPMAPAAVVVAKAAPVAVMPKVEKAPPKPKAEKLVAKPKAKAEAKPKAEAAGKPAKAAAKPKVAKAAKPVGLVRLTAPRKGLADDLKEIEGIGPALEKTVNAMGFFHFDQIAAWTDADVALVDAEMKNFKGRISRDKWVEQAKIIVSEGLEAFRERAKTNDY